MAQIQFELDTRHKKLNKLSNIIARIKEEHGPAIVRDDYMRVRVYGKRLWRLEDVRDAWIKEYTKSRGL
jgi:hypothetical protein